MYVCNCKAVTERDVYDCVAREGVSTLRELRQCTGVASQCGKCADHARAVLQEARSGDRYYSLSDALFG